MHGISIEVFSTTLACTRNKTLNGRAFNGWNTASLTHGEFTLRVSGSTGGCPHFPTPGRGEADQAFAWLDKAVNHKDTGLVEVANEPLFANLHDDSRWLPFLRSLGRAPEQLAAIEFEVKIPR